jgi:hypothetical protein
MKKTYLSFTCFFALWLLAAVLSYDVAFWTKGVVQFFATGVTAYKDFLFLFWAALGFAVLAFHSRPVRAMSARPLLVLTGVLSAVNLGAHFWLMSKFGLNAKSRILTVGEEAVSSNHFCHTHIMKPMLMPIINGLGLRDLLTKTDPGGPYYDLLPHWLYFASLMLALVLCCLIIRMLIQKRDEWPDERRTAFVLTYVVTSYVIIKSMFDGGPLTPEFIVYFSAWLVLLGTHRWEWGALFGRFAVSMAVTAGVVLSVNAMISLEDVPQLFLRVVAIAPFPVFLVVATYMVRNRRTPWRLMLAAVFSLGILTWGASAYFWANGLELMNLRLGENDVVYISNQTGENYEYPVAYQEGNLKIHAFSAPGKKLGDVFRQHKIPVNYGRVSVASKDNNINVSAGYVSSGEMVVVRGRELDTSKTSNMFVYFNVDPIEKGRRYRYEASIKGFLPNGNEELIINHFREMGQTFFILVPDNPHF